jgi:cytochrome c oxidase assembly protein subunit 15
MSHFLLSAVVLGGAVVLVLAALGAEQGLASRVVPRELQYLGYAAVAACLVLLVTGTIVTAAGPHPGDSSKVHRLWRLGSAIYVHAGATAAFAAWLVFALGYLAAQRRRLPRLFLAAVGLAALLGAQMAIGETQYHTRLPWWLVLIHVGIAAAVWTATVALAMLLRRPISAFAPQPVD